MFWDGTRWVEEGAPAPVSARPRPRHRIRDWLATGIMAVALVGLAIPTTSTSAASLPSGASLVSTWAKTAEVKTYDESNSKIGYKGKWTRADHAKYLGGHVRFASRSGSYATMTFTGSAVSWIGPVGSTRGKAKVYIDGKHVKTVDTWARSFQPARVLFKTEWAEVGEHRITVWVVGTKGHPVVAIDAFVVKADKSTTAPPAAPPTATDATAAPSGLELTASQSSRPRVALTEDIGPAGSETTLRFTGFRAGSTGRIEFDGSTRGMPTYRVSRSGSAVVRVTIPADATPGEHDIDAVDSRGRTLVSRIFEVTASAAAAAPTPTPSPTGTPKPSPTATPKPSATAAPTATPTSTPKPNPTAAPTAAPTATPKPSPTATPPSSGTYDAVFTGDATGATDVTSALKSFLQANSGRHVALAVNGVYKVTQMSFTAHDLTIDFRGARIQGAKAGASGIFRIQTSTNIVVNDAKVYGTGYSWSSSLQNEHGIHIDGGAHITLNRPVTRNTRGDGIYTSYQSSKNSPPVDVEINDPDIERASRNGIAPVAGEVAIRGGHIAYVGLHGVDFEVNDATGAASIRGIVDGVDIRHHGDIPGVELTSYAIAAGGYSTATKPSMMVQNVTGDVLKMTIRNTANVTVRNNVSDSSTFANFPGSGSVAFTNNLRISKQ